MVLKRIKILQFITIELLLNFDENVKVESFENYRNSSIFIISIKPFFGEDVNKHIF